MSLTYSLQLSALLCLLATEVLDLRSDTFSLTVTLPLCLLLKKTQRKRITSDKFSAHNVFLSTQCSENNSPMIICLRSAGDDFVAGQVKHSSHDEQPAGKAKICFIFRCICLREREGCLACHKTLHIAPLSSSVLCYIYPLQPDFI